MKKIIIVLFLLFLPSISWSDEYVLVMSKEDNVCQHMLKLYNEDLRKYGEIKYDEHEEFNAIKWEEKKYYTTYPDGKKHYPMSPPDTVLISRFDINHDGKEEIVVKQAGFLKGILSEALYYFNGEDADYFKDAEFDVYLLYTKATGSVGTGAFKTNVYGLKELPKIFIGNVLGKETYNHYSLGGHFYVNPFVFKGSYYVDMREKQDNPNPYRWLVILRYDKDNQIKDTCYFLKASNCKNNKPKRRK